MELENYRAKTPGDAFELELEDLAEGSQKLYRRWFSNFLAFVGSTPEELLVFHEENRGAVRRAVLGYQRHLVEEYCKHGEKCDDFKKGCRCERWEGLHPNTAKFVGKAVSKFLSANDFDDFRMRDKSGVGSKGKKVLNHEQILRLYRDAGKSLRLKAMVMTFKDVGFRPSDIANMRVEDFISARKIHTESGEFRSWMEPQITQKNKVAAYVHLGPESVEDLKRYIGDRTQGAIFLTERSMPHYILNDDGTRTMNGESTQPGEAMTRSNVGSCIKTLCKPLKAEGYDVSAASLRKFFFTYLPATKMDLQHCKLIAGKKLPPVDAPYIQTAETGELTRLYIENYDALRIFKDTDTKAQQERIDRHEEKLEHFTEKAQEIMDKMTLYAPLIDDLIEANKEGTQLPDIDQRLKALKVKPQEE